MAALTPIGKSVFFVVFVFYTFYKPFSFISHRKLFCAADIEKDLSPSVFFYVFSFTVSCSAPYKIDNSLESFPIRWQFYGYHKNDLNIKKEEI